MVYFGKLKGLGKEQARRWSRDYLERVGIGDKEKVRLDKLSGGQQQKVQLGVTIMNDPELLILDEPTKGFDPVNRRLLMDIIDDQKKAGSTVMMVTHQMEEVERLCDRVILLKDGGARAYGTVAEVQEQFGGTDRARRSRRGHPAVARLHDRRRMPAVTPSSRSPNDADAAVDPARRSSTPGLDSHPLRPHPQIARRHLRRGLRRREQGAGLTMAQHNLGTVVSFEFLRTITQAPLLGDHPLRPDRA